MTTIQKINCQKCLQDSHEECLDPETCLCAGYEHGRKTKSKFGLTQEAQDMLTVEKLKESAKLTEISEIIDIEKPSQVAGYLMKQYTFKTLRDTWEVLVYKDGVYLENAEVLIAEICRTINTEIKKSNYNEILFHIQSSTFTDREQFNNDLTRLVLENGILNLETLELSDYDPNFLTTIKLPIEYDPKAWCPKFVSFLKDCLEPHDIVTVIEEMANILNTNRKNFEVSAMWIGDGANGKTCLLNMIGRVFGSANCSNVSIHAMQNQPFSIYQLDGKLANLHGDISNKELNSLGLFKQIISGEPLPCSKKFKDPFTLVSFAKHFFSANEMPDIKDNSDGAFRRIYVTKWENQFIAGVNRIEDLDKIILKEEKNGIFNLIIENYKTLIKENVLGFKPKKGFRYKQSIAQVREVIKRESDKLREFVEMCLIPDPNSFIETGKLYLETS